MKKSESPLEPVVNVNRDPITGEHGSHPVGTGLGSAGGAAGDAAADKRFDEVEAELERTWPSARGNSRFAGITAWRAPSAGETR